MAALGSPFRASGPAGHVPATNPELSPRGRVWWHPERAGACSCTARARARAEPDRGKCVFRGRPTPPGGVCKGTQARPTPPGKSGKATQGRPTPRGTFGNAAQGRPTPPGESGKGARVARRLRQDPGRRRRAPRGASDGWQAVSKVAGAPPGVRPMAGRPCAKSEACSPGCVRWLAVRVKSRGRAPRGASDGWQAL